MIVSKGTSLTVQWLEFWPFIAKDARLIPGQETQDPSSCTVQPKQNKQTKKTTVSTNSETEVNEGKTISRFRLKHDFKVNGFLERKKFML